MVDILKCSGVLGLLQTVKKEGENDMQHSEKW